MTQKDIELFAQSFENVEWVENLGYIFFFIGTNHFVPFVSIATKDNEGDAVSNLSREGVFRVNIGVSKQTFDAVFPHNDADSSYDYHALDVFMPHPHYAKQFYLCILNPSEKHDDEVKKYIREAYTIMARRHAHINNT